MNRKHLTIVLSCASLWCTLPDASAQAITTFTAPTNGTAAMLEPEIIPSPYAGGPVVGLSSRDGITYSVPDVLVTRNGVSQRLTTEMRLANGTRVFPDGTVILAGGNRVTFRPEQVLGFSGMFEEAPIAEAVIDYNDITAGLVRRATEGASRARPAGGRWYGLPEK